MNGPYIRAVAHPMSGLPDIGIYLRKSAKADLRWLAPAALAPHGDGSIQSAWTNSKC